MKKTKGPPCEWMTEDVKGTMDQRDKLLQKAEKTNQDTYWNKYRSFRNKCNIMQKKAKAMFHKNLLAENRLNPKEFRRSVKKVFSTNNKKTGDGHNPKDDKSRAEKF